MPVNFIVFCESFITWNLDPISINLYLAKHSKNQSKYTATAL